MDRFSLIQFLKNPRWILCSILFFNSAIASEITDNQTSSVPVAEKAQQQINAAANQTSNTSPTSAADNAQVTTGPTTSSLDALTTQFPSLQRALIILTIINFIIIVFGLMMYLVKRRMQQFSPASMVRLNPES